MRRVNKNMGVIFFTMGVFWLAAGMTLWRLIDKGAKTSIVVSLVCFSVAAVVWTGVAIKLQKEIPKD